MGKPITIQYRKLGKERAYGLAWSDDRIELDKRLKPYQKLLYAIHEWLHIENPTWSETKVKKESSKIAKFLYHNGCKIII